MRPHAAASQAVQIPFDGGRLQGDLNIPAQAAGLVLFVHGSGSSRLSPRNRWVAQALNQAGLGTLLFDLLTASEEVEDARTRHLRFDIPLLADRLRAATDWVRSQERTASLPVGYFGASTGAAAALIAAAREGPNIIQAVVSRGGRPDLAEGALANVSSPVLLMVGGLDDVVIDLNRQAYDRLPSGVIRHLEIVPGASHLFEEPGKLEVVAELAADWFRRYLHG